MCRGREVSEATCEHCRLPECQFYKTKTGCKSGDTCLFPHYKVDEQPNKRPKKGYFPKRRESEDKGAVAIVKSVSQLGRVSQDSDVLASRVPGNPDAESLGPIRRVRFTKSTLRGTIKVKPRHQRSPYAFKFEDRSHEETERQERCAQSKARDLAKNIYKANEKATFFSFTEKWVLENVWLVLERKCIWSVRKTFSLLSWRP